MSVSSKSRPLKRSGSRVASAQGVGEAVAEVQSCGVVALAESPPGLACRLRLFRSDRLQFDLCPSKEPIKLVAGCGTEAAFEDNCSLQESGGGYAAGGGRGNGSFEALCVGFPEQDGQDCRRVDDHLGSPLSSYSRSPWSVEEKSVGKGPPYGGV